LRGAARAGSMYCVRPAETIPCWAVQLAGCQSSMVGSTNKPPCDADGVRQPGDWLHPTEAETRTALYMRNQNHAKGGADKLAEAMSIRLSYSLNDIKPSKLRTLKHQKRKMKSKLLNAVWGAYLGCPGCSGGAVGQPKPYVAQHLSTRHLKSNIYQWGLRLAAAGYCWLPPATARTLLQISIHDNSILENSIHFLYNMKYASIRHLIHIAAYLQKIGGGSQTRLSRTSPIGCDPPCPPAAVVP
jgi:hypothetical protein